VFCFCVPYNSSDGTEFEKVIEIDYSSSYDETMQILYREIGCADVPKQNLPILGCHFSKKPKKSRIDIANWDLVKQEYRLEVGKNGQNALINIILPNNVSAMKYNPYNEN